ncbi:MAG: DNA methyltransferase [Candidatus Dadabacteria bacterium]|nr:DNA methyltransferase [Candidatus Dadabacteria bacterium]
MALKTQNLSSVGIAPSLPFVSQHVNGTEQSALQILYKTDWDFCDATTNGATHSFHPYPARFIPQIPAVLIRAFTKLGETIYDPFVGGGTSCVEANIVGRHALGGDANGLAVLIARAKSCPPAKGSTAAILQTAIHAKRQAENLNNKVTAPALSVEWFDDFIIREIAAIKQAITGLQGASEREFCFVALSAILIGVSKQDSDTRYVRVPKNLSPGDAIVRYERQLRKMLRLMDLCRADLLRGMTDVRVADSRIPGTFADDSADFVVTSPPYPNAYDYHLYHRHRLLWLDMDPAELKQQEIGAHAHYSRRNGPDENDFRRDMERVFRASSRILKRGRYFALVVGDSILHGRRVRNRDIVKDAAYVAGFTSVIDFRRRMNSRRKSFNPAHGNIHTEDIVILRNDRRQ